MSTVIYTEELKEHILSEHEAGISGWTGVRYTVRSKGGLRRE